MELGMSVPQRWFDIQAISRSASHARRIETKRKIVPHPGVAWPCQEESAPFQAGTFGQAHQYGSNDHQEHPRSQYQGGGMVWLECAEQPGEGIGVHTAVET
jgi:hypothetical protein